MIYFKDGDIIAESGKARVYKLKEGLFLEIGDGHHLWTLDTELKEYIAQIKDLAKGDALEIGLGLGVASRYILSFPKVEALTTIEINKDVIEVHKIVRKTDTDYMKNFSYKPHNIVNADGLEYIYKSNNKFDFIFLDFYDRIDEDTIPAIKDMVRGCKRLLNKDGVIVGWFDPYTPEEFVDCFYNIFEH